MAWSLAVFLLAMTSTGYGTMFTYVDGNPKDPQFVALLRAALMHVGINPTGLQVLTVQYNYQGVRTSYKMTYIANDGKKCFLHWRIDALFGSLSPEMPVCENAPLGIGRPNPVGFPGVYQTISYTPTQPPGLHISASVQSSSKTQFISPVQSNISGPSIGHITTQITSSPVYCTKPPCPAPSTSHQVTGGSSNNPQSASSKKLDPYEKYLRKSH